MSLPKIKISRDELYEKVWTTVIHELSAEFSLSDAGLGKVSWRHQIPVPGPGILGPAAIRTTPQAPFLACECRSEIQHHRGLPKRTVATDPGDRARELICDSPAVIATLVRISAVSDR